MKEGAGEDPFAEDPDTDSESSQEDPGATLDSDPKLQSEPSSRRDRRQSQQSVEIPYIYRRDGVQDGRNRVPLFLMPESKRQERDVRHELEDRFDTSVPLTDVREALLKAGVKNLDDVEDQLTEWGYGMTFDD